MKAADGLTRQEGVRSDANSKLKAERQFNLEGSKLYQLQTCLVCKVAAHKGLASVLQQILIGQHLLLSLPAQKLRLRKHQFQGTAS
jgi:hypothetical protein